MHFEWNIDGVFLLLSDVFADDEDGMETSALLFVCQIKIAPAHAQLLENSI